MKTTQLRRFWLMVWVVLALVAGHWGSGRAARQAADGAPAVHVVVEPGGGFGGFGGGSSGGGGAGGSW